jgi:hypothetical protein
LRKDRLCNPDLCNDREDHEDRCPDCPLNKLDEAQGSEQGQLLKRATELKSALRLGLHVTLDDIDADELYAMLTIEEEVNRFEEEKPDGNRQR